MSTSDSESPTPKSDWQAETTRTGPSNIGLYARRTVLTLLLIASLGGLAYLLFVIFMQPTTHVAIIRADGLPVLHGPPATIARMDTAMFEPLADVVTYHGAESFDTLFTSKAEMERLEGRLQELNVGRRDTFILYVAAHGIDFNGKAYLVCDDFDPGEPSRGIYPVRDLLRQLNAALPDDMPKLLIIDVGQYDYDPQLGIVVSEFPRLLEELVRQANDPSLWVLCSHSTLQKSHTSRALGGSVFGAFVSQGLRGHADGAIDRVADGFVTTNELAHFTTASVSAWVGQSTNGQSRQTPQLFWSGSDDASESAKLLPVADPPPGEISIPDMIREAERGPRQRAFTRQDIDGRGLLSRLSPAEGDTTAATSVTDPSAADGAQSDAAGQAASPTPPNVGQRLRRLFSQAWRVRDQLADIPLDRSATRAVDDTPHLWRELQEELIGFEHQLTSTNGEDERLSSMVALLEKTLPMFSRETEDQTVLNRDLMTLGATAPTPSNALPAFADVRSLALAKLAAEQGWLVPRDKINELAQQLNSMLELPPDEFKLAMSEKTSWEEYYDRYYELRLLKELATLNLDPELVQLAVRTRRDGELVATSGLVSSDWLMQDVVDGDRYRLAGERQMVDQFGLEWAQRARDNLVRARDKYRVAQEKTQEIERAIRLRNELLFDAPYYVRLRRASYASWTDESLEVYDSLNRFLDLLTELSLALDVPSPEGVATVKQLGQNLVRLRDQRIRVQKSRLNFQNPSDGDAWHIDLLLETPLPGSVVRQRLLSQARDVDADIARRFNLNPASPSGDGWNQLRRLCALELKVARLSVWPADGDPSFVELPQAYAELEQAVAAEQPDRWSKYRKFSQELREFHATRRDLLAQLQAGELAGATRDVAQAKVVRAERALRQLDARDAHQFRDLRISVVARRLHAHDVLNWHQHRFAVARADASEAEVRFLDQAAEAYQLQALRLLRPATADLLARQQVRVDTPKRLSLLQRSTRDLPVMLTYLGAGKAQAWFILQYDPELIEVDAPDNVYHEHELPLRMRAGRRDDTSEADHVFLKTRRAFQYPLRPDLVALDPTFEELNNGDARSLQLRVSAKTNDVDVAQLVVKVVVPSPSDQFAARPQTYLRNPVQLTFRTFDLAVDGAPSSWSVSGDAVAIFPFPNRLTGYRFGAINHGSVARDITLRFFVPSAPVNLSDLSPEAMLDQLDEWIPADRFTLEQVARGKRFTAKAEDGEEAAPADNPVSAATDENAEAEASGARQPPKGPSLEHGLMVELSDPNDARFRFVRQIEIEAQRPRRYVRPRVRYNARLERIDVTVTARDRSLVPTRSIHVECDLAERPAEEIEGKLRDTITISKPLAKLFVNVPAIPAQEVTLQLHVDGYPRAFVYKVPCGAETVDVGEQTGLMEARMLKPDSIDGFQAPSPTTPIELQIDAPVGSFEADEDFVLLALDEDFDEQLDIESALRLTSDRQVSSHIESLAEGALTLDTRVSDFQIPLSTRKLRNVDIDVMGRLSVGTRDKRARPLTLRIDGGAPRIYRVAINPPSGNILAGQELEISVWARDQMSRIKGIEAAFDFEGTGQFSEGAEVVEATFDPFVKRWIAKLSTEKLLGAQTLLVRATDIVNNTSEPFSVPLRVLTPEQIEMVNVIQPKVVRGVVTYDKQPIEDVDVTLLTPDGRAVTPVKTDERGSYLFSRVPPGEYVLVARGVFYNVWRGATRDIVIDANTGRVVHADIELE